VAGGITHTRRGKFLLLWGERGPTRCGFAGGLTAIVPLIDPQEPISAAVARAGADGLDMTMFPVLAAPMWAFADADRNAMRLPFLPL
jgi:hypothetical protein